MKYLEHFVVSFLIRGKEISKVLSLDAEHVFALLLEALDPLIVCHINNIDRQNEPPVEIVQLKIALLTTEQAIILILNLKYI